jgi:hypothetical protein
MDMIGEHGDDPADIPEAIETDKNLLVVALSGAGFPVYPINPRAVARYRERHGQAGGKSDSGDAAVLANILRTDRPMHRPLAAISEHALAIKALARQHQEAIWALNQTASRLRSVLLEFYPVGLGNAMQRADLRSSRAVWPWIIVGCCCFRSCISWCGVCSAWPSY